MLIPSVSALFGNFTPGYGLVDGGLLKQLVDMLFSSEHGIVAAAGGGQADATPLTARFNYVSTVETAEDSVQLPVAVPGLSIVVVNGSAETMAVFGSPSNPNTGVGDTIAAANSNTQQDSDVGVTQATTVMGIYVCTTAGQWKQGLMVS